LKPKWGGARGVLKSQPKANVQPELRNIALVFSERRQTKAARVGGQKKKSQAPDPDRRPKDLTEGIYNV